MSDLLSVSEDSDSSRLDKLQLSDEGQSVHVKMYNTPVGIPNRSEKCEKH